MTKSKKNRINKDRTKVTDSAPKTRKFVECNCLLHCGGGKLVDPRTFRRHQEEVNRLQTIASGSQSSSKLKDEKQLNLLQQQTINKENIGHNYQGDNESTIICSNPVTSRWCGRLECIAENIETISGNNKKQRKCKGCQGIGHDLRNCKSKALGERN
ncbi:22294_t:CDS:2 [Rhizophagus irregularis]|nr:22294_t:CDS:2 [Rhizophagus irregularis]